MTTMRHFSNERGYWWTGTGTNWRVGRAHIKLNNAGRRRYWQGPLNERQPDWGKRGTLGVNIEWHLLDSKKNGHGWGWYLRWGTNGSETTPDIGLFAGRAATAFISFEQIVPYRWLERWKPSARPAAEPGNKFGLYSVERSGKPGRWEADYDTREFGIRCGHDSLDDWFLEFDCWARSGQWSRSDPWWMHQRWGVKRTLFGRTTSTSVVDDEGTCIVPMPEANYPATWTTTTWTNTYTRSLGRARDRLLDARTHTSTSIEPGRPLPIPGKGESDYDLDDDHISSSSSPGSNVDAAIGALVASALRTRRRHGGMHMSLPNHPPDPTETP